MAASRAPVEGLTERKVSKLLPALDEIALLDRRLDASDHHGADADGHDAAELRTVDGHDLPRVLSVDVQRRPDRLRLQRNGQHAPLYRPQGQIKMDIR